MDKLTRIYHKVPISSIIVMIWLSFALIGPLLIHEIDHGIFTPIVPYGPSSIDLANSGSIGPFDHQNIESLYYRHWLGTDEIGRDVLAQLVYGSRTALVIGFFSVLISAILGIMIGAIPAFLGDKGFKVNRTHYYIIGIASIMLFLYLSFVYPWKYSPHAANLLMISVASLFLFISWKNLVRKGMSHKNVAHIPVDLISGRVIETMESLPILFIIISLSAVVEASSFMVILIIGISNWAHIARYARSETLKVKQRRSLNLLEHLA